MICMFNLVGDRNADLVAGSCRAGKECKFLHDGTRLPEAPMHVKEDQMDATAVSGVDEDGMVQDRTQAVQQPQRTVVARPIPQAQTLNPRDFQLGQLRRRFSPKESIQRGSTVLKFNLTPSDPDFPFEMTSLTCLLSIPKDYPRLRPSLRVENKDIPRGFALNVEAGFNSLAEEKTAATLLELIKLLDRDLELFLSAPKVDTVKIVVNKDTRHLDKIPSRPVADPSKSSQQPPVSALPSTNVTNSAPRVQSFTAEVSFPLHQM